jgi:hypothetical protein
MPTSSENVSNFGISTDDSALPRTKDVTPIVTLIGINRIPNGNFRANREISKNSTNITRKHEWYVAATMILNPVSDWISLLSDPFLAKWNVTIAGSNDLHFAQSNPVQMDYIRGF